ncbi:hypothetical protein BDQ17DRAFT_1355746 [Cyathus striatus]|nr:hypothetical protein BDQ17DRAFT_1355746 [Cyathus striatus]
MSTDSNIPDNVVFTSGPLLLGYLLSWGLYGILCVQVYVYYLAFPNDRLYAKILVYLIFILESVQSILVAHDAFEAYAKGFGSFEALTDEYFSWLTMPIIGGVAALFVQLFYAYRISVLGKSKIPAILIVVMATIQGGSAITAGILAAKAKNLTKLTTLDVRIVQGVWAGVSAGCDVFIAICMSYQLSKREAVFPSTQAFLARILRLIIGTGSLTAVVAVLNLTLFNVFEYGTAFLAPGALLGKLYSNSMMVILNSRLDIVGGRHSSQRLNEVIVRPSSDLRDTAFNGSSRLSEKGFGIESPVAFLRAGGWNRSDTDSSESRNTRIEIGITKQTTVITS